jgi:hypothetical protein
VFKSLERAQPEYYQWCELLSSWKKRIFRGGLTILALAGRIWATTFPHKKSKRRR